MEREREITLSTRWNYVGMKTVLAERVSGVGWSVSVRLEPRVIRRKSTSRSEKPSAACCCRHCRCRTE